jgi:hypothetical protein
MTQGPPDFISLMQRQSPLEIRPRENNRNIRKVRKRQGEYPELGHVSGSFTDFAALFVCARIVQNFTLPNWRWYFSFTSGPLLLHKSHTICSTQVSFLGNGSFKLRLWSFTIQTFTHELFFQLVSNSSFIQT